MKCCMIEEEAEPQTLLTDSSLHLRGKQGDSDDEADDDDDEDSTEERVVQALSYLAPGGELQGASSRSEPKNGALSMAKYEEALPTMPIHAGNGPSRSNGTGLFVRGDTPRLGSEEQNRAVWQSPIPYENLPPTSVSTCCSDNLVILFDSGLYPLRLEVGLDVNIIEPSCVPTYSSSRLLRILLCSYQTSILFLRCHRCGEIIIELYRSKHQ
jgi:hypothetical protein